MASPSSIDDVNTSTRRHRGAIVAIIAVLAAIAAVAVAIAWDVTHTARPLIRITMDLGPDAALDDSAHISPDGKRIVYAVGTGPGRKLAVRLLDQDAPVILAGTENVVEPFFSPDSRWIAFFADGQLKKISVDYGAPQKVCDVSGSPQGGAWTEDGAIVFAPDTNQGLYRVPASGGEAPRKLTNPQDKNQVSHRWPQILLDGEWVLFTASAATGNFDNAEIDALNLSSGQWRTVQPGGFFGRFLESGNLVYVHHGTLFSVEFDARHLRTRGAPVPVLTDLSASASGGDGHFDASTEQGGSLFTYLSQEAPHQNSTDANPAFREVLLLNFFDELTHRTK
jgi:hypothetical protein